MNPGDFYRTKAAIVLARAKREERLQLQTELESLAQAYLRLAEQADRNEMLDASYEIPPDPTQQQQQKQPKPDSESNR